MVSQPTLITRRKLSENSPYQDHSTTRASMSGATARARVAKVCTDDWKVQASVSSSSHYPWNPGPGWPGCRTAARGIGCGSIPLGQGRGRQVRRRDERTLEAPSRRATGWHSRHPFDAPASPGRPTQTPRAIARDASHLGHGAERLAAYAAGRDSRARPLCRRAEDATRDIPRPPCCTHQAEGSRGEPGKEGAASAATPATVEARRADCCSREGAGWRPAHNARRGRR